MSWFDYEEAELDVLENGGDPDFLNTRNPEKRDAYLRNLGLRPENYGSDLKKSTPTKATSSDGCYIATCVYGSYDCPQVWTLRRFRDCTLAKSLPGRAFIKLYYATSPHLVKWFGKTHIFQRVFKSMLDPFVQHLKSEGYSDTAYDDRR